MFDGQLRVLDRLAPFARHEDLLGVARDGRRSVPRAIVAGPGLVRSMVGERRVIAQLREHEHRRSREVGLDEAHAGIGQHEGPLTHGDTRLAGQSAIHVRHHRGLSLLSHQDGPDAGLMVVERVEDRDRLAARHAEHELDAGFLQDPDDRLRRRDRSREQLPCRHGVDRPFVATPEAATAGSSPRY